MGSGASAANMNVLPKVNVSQPPPTHTHTHLASRPSCRQSIIPSIFHPSILPPRFRPPSSSSVASSRRSYLNFSSAPPPQGLLPGYLTTILLHLLSSGKAFLSVSHRHRSRRGVDLRRGVGEEAREGGGREREMRLKMVQKTENQRGRRIRRMLMSSED